LSNVLQGIYIGQSPAKANRLMYVTKGQRTTSKFHAYSQCIFQSLTKSEKRVFFNDMDNVGHAQLFVDV
jgi:hypothetical protein